MLVADLLYMYISKFYNRNQTYLDFLRNNGKHSKGKYYSMDRGMSPLFLIARPRLIFVYVTLSHKLINHVTCNTFQLLLYLNQYPWDIFLVKTTNKMII